MNNFNSRTGMSVLSQENATLTTPSMMDVQTRMDDITAQSKEQMLWAAAQGLALAKLKVFGQMAKSVNDQAGQ